MTEDWPLDPRAAAVAAGVDMELVGCPVIACSSGPHAPIMVATVTAPGGRQRAVRGCPKHLAVLVDQALARLGFLYVGVKGGDAP